MSERGQKTTLFVIVLVIFGLASLAVFSSNHPQNCYAGAKLEHGQGNPQEQCWTERAANDPVSVFTCLLVIIGAFQLVLFWWQLNLIRGSADDAKATSETALRAAIAAENSVKNASDTAQKQLRAWVFTGVSGASLDLPSNQKFYVDHRVVNRGLTPAKVTGISMQVTLLPNPLPANYRMPIPSILQMLVVLAPAEIADAGHWESDSVLTPLDILDIKSDTRRMYFFGVLEYLDIFENPCKTEFCMSLNGKSIHNGKTGQLEATWEPTPWHNDFT